MWGCVQGHQPRLEILDVERDSAGFPCTGCGIPVNGAIVASVAPGHGVRQTSVDLLRNVQSTLRGNKGILEDGIGGMV